MACFVIFNSTTGLLQGSYNVSHAEDLPAVMLANTPNGSSALIVETGHPVLTDQTGWEVVDGALTEVVPTAAELLAAAQRSQAAAIEAAYQTATFLTGISYMGTTFWTDQNSQVLLMGAMMGCQAAGGVPAGFAWWDATNTPVPMTLTELQGLAQGIFALVNANFLKRKTLLSSVADATTIADVEAVVW